MPKGFFFICILCGLLLEANAQIRIQRYTPGAFMSDNQHKLELINSGNKSVDISEYVIINRDYFIKIPRGTRLEPGQILILVKKKEGREKNVLELSTSSFFVTRNYSLKVGGNYVVVFDSRMNIQDAFYYSQLKNPPFLPDELFSTFPNGEFVKIQVPSAGNRVWSYYPIGDDPAITFEQVKKEWRLASSRTKKYINTALAFQEFSVRYNDGIVSLNWTTAFEENSREIEIERSMDQQIFTPIGRISTQGNSREFQYYRYADPETQNRKTYYYRLKHTDGNGHIVYSKTQEIKTIPLSTEYYAEIIRSQGSGENISIRFFSAFSQRIHMRILNENMEVMMNLFDSYVYADVQNLIKLNRPLRPGRYFLVSATDTRRFWQEWVVD